MALVFLTLRGGSRGAEVVSLAVETGGDGRAGVGFEEMVGGRTGVGFTNRLTVGQSMQNQNWMNGSGVAAGDFDGDGNCDLYFCAIAGTNALYRNLGGWRFEDVTVQAGVGGTGWASTGAVFGDLDGDGDLDLLVATLGTGVHAFRNDGRGSFRETTREDGWSSATGSTSFALGDVDADGDVDVYVANYGAMSVLRSGGRVEVQRVNGEWVVKGPHAHRLRYVEGRMEEVGEADVLYLNDGRGRFEAVKWGTDRFVGIDGKPKAAPLDYGLGVQMRDVDGNGTMDLYVCNDYQTPDRLWLNDGTGRFREAGWPVLRKFPFSSMGVDFGDLDRDGHLDFLVVEMASRDQARRMAQLSGATPMLNLPGRVEGRPQVVRNVLYRGNGDGTWSDVAEYAGIGATDWSWQPVFLDVDLDGFEDVLVVNGAMFDTLDRDALARTEALGRQSPESSRTNLLMYPSFHSPNVALRNRGNLTFEDRSREWAFDSTRISQGIALADLDNDGDLDLAVNCLNDGALLYRNRSAAPRVAVRARGRGSNTQGLGAEVTVRDGDRVQRQALVGGGRYASGDQVQRTFAIRSEGRATIDVRWPSGRRTRVVDVPANRRVMVDEADAEAPEEKDGGETFGTRPWFADVSAELNHRHHEAVFDDFARQPLLARQLSGLGPGVAWCDFDGDGRGELVVGTGRGGGLVAFHWNGAGALERWETGVVAPDDVLGLCGWRTAEGRPALLAAVSGYESGTGASLVEVTADPSRRRLQIALVREMPSVPGESVGPIAATDMDGDGDLEVVVGGRVRAGAYPESGPTRLFRREAGRLRLDAGSNAVLENAGMVSDVAWADLDADGFPELILAVEWGPVRVYRNERGQLRVWDPEVIWAGRGKGVTRLSHLTGWWTSVVSGDFDGDGRTDLGVGNWGLNTGYQARPDAPASLYFGRFTGGAMDLIEARVAPEMGVEVPLRSLNALARAIPGLAAVFPNHQTYARSPMTAVLRALPAVPGRREATTLESVVLLNRGDRFEVRPLPAEAQFAPVFGLVALDIDDDGQEDLLAAQNFFGARVEWPRTDAGRGCWLRGRGDGTFEAVDSRLSGVVMTGEQRGAALGDFDGDGRPDLAVGQSGATTVLWRNQIPSGTPGGIGLRVRANAGAGNPDGYGVRIRGRRGDKWGPVREIRAGGGYGSQNEPCLWWGGKDRPEDLEAIWPGGARTRVRVPPGVKELVLQGNE